MGSPEMNSTGVSLDHSNCSVSHSHTSPDCSAGKSVAFELIMNEEGSPYRARLPMRVQIYPHDATESIVTTVKNFYGLYAGPARSKGVSFEDDEGNTLIASFENFRHNMVVYVRVLEEHTPYAPFTRKSNSNYFASEGNPLQEPAHAEASQNHSRSHSPDSHSRRSNSAATNHPNSGHTGVKTFSGYEKKQSTDYDGYSSGDASTSTRNKSDQIGNTDISLDNIVEGGRRRKAKFESSELPLFAPPQMPAAPSNPSVSPTRRIDSNRNSIAYSTSNQNVFNNVHPLQSPQNYGYTQNFYGISMPDSRAQHPSACSNQTTSNGMAPTPDPTISSNISDEDKDVAIQLMRLGDVSNVSNASNARTSASAQDEMFSGHIENMSSTGVTSDADSEAEIGMPPSRRQRLDESGASKPTHQFTKPHMVPASEDDFAYNMAPSLVSPTKMRIPNLIKPKTMATPRAKGLAKTPKAPKTTGVTSAKTKKTVALVETPGISTMMTGVQMSPSSLPPSRKQSVSSMPGLQPSEDEQPDLSTKPRCQRCRKSKKGCDRQRPCGRCRDAGLSADQCISEDEGNGRKGRYGRHMGVPIKKDETHGHSMTTPVQTPIPIPTNGMSSMALLPPASIAPTFMTVDKNKKRKR